MVGDSPIDIVARADSALLQQAYAIVRQYVSYGGSPAPAFAPPARTAGTNLVQRAAEIAPYLPSEGLSGPHRDAVILLLNTAAGCAACVDRLLTIQEGNDPLAKAALSDVLSVAQGRKDTIEVAGSLSPAEFEAFLRHLFA